MKNKITIRMAVIIGGIGIIIPYVEMIINKEISFYYVISSILIGISYKLRSIANHRNDKIKEIFENATEENKEKLYNYAKEIEKET